MFLFLFFVILNNFLINTAVKETIKVKLPLDIPTGTPVTVVKEIKDTPPIVADKTIKILSL